MPESLEKSLQLLEARMRQLAGLAPIAGGAPASAEYTLERINEVVGGWTPGGDPTPAAFVGCRYPMANDGDYIRGFNDIGIFAGPGPNAELPYYDVGGFATLNGGYTDNGFFEIPQAGYYRISVSCQVGWFGPAPGFDPSDAVAVEFVITSSRDGDWDTLDHVTAIKYGDGSNDTNTGLTITHWLNAGDEVSLSRSYSGSVQPGVKAAMEIVFVGSGIDPS